MMTKAELKDRVAIELKKAMAEYKYRNKGVKLYRKMCKDLNIREGNIATWISGRATPNFMNLLKLKEFFGDMLKIEIKFL